MRRLVVTVATAVALAGCAGMEHQAPSEQGKTEFSTGSNIPRRTGVQSRDTKTMSREEYERQMEKGPTYPKGTEF